MCDSSRIRLRNKNMESEILCSLYKSTESILSNSVQDDMTASMFFWTSVSHTLLRIHIATRSSARAETRVFFALLGSCFIWKSTWFIWSTDSRQKTHSIPASIYLSVRLSVRPSISYEDPLSSPKIHYLHHINWVQWNVTSSLSSVGCASSPTCNTWEEGICLWQTFNTHLHKFYNVHRWLLVVGFWA